MNGPPEHDPDVDVDVAVVGAGASGLFLAASLVRAGARVAVFEERTEPTTHSRAIGIHPPGLAALDRLGIADGLRAAGVEVRRGHASAGDARSGVRTLGRLDFDATLPDPFRFVLSVPQATTEAALESALHELAPDALRRGVQVTDWDDDGSAVRLVMQPADTASGGTEIQRELSAGLMVMCTGARGDAAARLGIAMHGGRYDDAYLMGDLPDAGIGPAGVRLGDDAAIHLAPGGVVEAFPLPGGIRRWVVKTDGRITDPTVHDLVRLVEARSAVRLDGTGATMLSSFGVQRLLAERMTHGRVWLAGDAAHVVAPIGGQGMTLAWLGAERLIEAWRSHVEGRMSLQEAAAGYERAQRSRALRAGTRAAWNLRLGRATRWDAPRRLLVRALLSPAFASRAARTFTMQA